MKKSQIAYALLDNFNVDPTEERLFVVESLLETKKIRRTEILNSLGQRKLTEHQARMLLQSLNQKKVIKWDVEAGVATVKFTDEAKTEIEAIKMKEFLEQAGEKFNKKVDDFEKSANEFIESAREGGDLLANCLADRLEKFATFIRKAKNSKNPKK